MSLPKLLLSLMLALAVHLLAPAVWAGVGDRVVLPVVGNSAKRLSGLQLQLDSHWVESPGYRPLYVTVNSLLPVTADRYLRVSVLPQDWSRSRQGVEFDIKLPEGATSARREIAVPQQGIWSQFEITVYENGRRLDDLSETVGVNRTVGSWSWTEAYPAMLFIDAEAPTPILVNAILAAASANGKSTLPDVLALAKLIAPMDDYAQNVWQAGPQRRDSSGQRLRSQDDEILTATQRLQTVALLPPAELPTQWQNYTCLDLVFISLADLGALSQKQPEVWAALREYVLAGGNLVVHGVGEGFAGLTTLDDLLAAPTTAATPGHPGVSADTWQPPRLETFGADLATLVTPDSTVRTFRNRRLVEEQTIDDEDGSSSVRPQTPVPESLFRWRPLGWGRVVALAPEDLNQADDSQWSWMLNDLGPDRWRWYRRHGMSVQRSNRSFWEFLIPGVGAAPVRTFLAVITAFVVIVGPINYFLLNRSRRLYLLLVTVPLGSALIIAGLLGFAVVKDGLGTRTRLRSFSRVLPEGRVISWSRQSYYSGLAPSSGLVYPTGAAVFPLEFDPSEPMRRRRITQWHQFQQLAPGYLNARSTAQQLVVNSTETAAPIELERAGEAPPQATNRSSGVVDHLFIIDQAETFWIEALSPGSTAMATPVPPAEAQQRYQQLLNERRPATPRGFTPPRGTRGYRVFYNNFDGGVSAADFGTNLLEQALVEPLSSVTPAGRVYYAVTSDAPEFVPVAVARSRQEEGLHVVQGQW